MDKNITKHVIIDFIQIGFAIIIASIGLKAFLLPNGFLDGGVTGIAILLSELFHIDISILLPIVSIPFFILGYFTITKRILLKSIICIICLSLAIHFENFSTITDDKLIIATFGGVFLGVGIGLAIRAGAVLDASELLGLYINEKIGLSIGQVILLFNIVLFAITAILLTPEIAMYSVLTYFITSKAIDFTIQGFENYVGLMIVSKKSELIEHEFLKNIGLGITVYQGVKGYGKSGVIENNQIIHVVVNRINARRISRIIEQIDEDAFITEFDVNNVKGGKLKKFLNKENTPSN
ncbi:YitT family protein [Tenacibaculum jejuense]|uniref:DUF2179 domain-containing protein n=1 Tax=Tenacibaculum jejuense TaxID=584609 RepID=A0A238U661_9FLAO|nr:YitT family protein [Tenacibaculum jejuense]SNR14701.1 conserved membrane protein of unknown function [Tenacibaculum jejuense]